MNEAPQCPRCGHNFYLGFSKPPNEDGLCQWCEEEVGEVKRHVPCHVCGAQADCLSPLGYLCDAEKCHKIDKLMQEIEYIRKYE